MQQLSLMVAIVLFVVGKLKTTTNKQKTTTNQTTMTTSVAVSIDTYLPPGRWPLCVCNYWFYYSWPHKMLVLSLSKVQFQNHNVP